MKSNHFFIPYAGNKRREVERIYNFLNQDVLEKTTTIVEPFCGTSAFSYFMSLKHPKKFNYVLNDNNEHLIELYKIAKSKTKLNKLVTTLNEMIIDIDKEKYNKMIKVNDLCGWIIKNKIYSIKAGLFPNDAKKIMRDFEYLKTCPMINFLRTEKIKFTNDNGINIYDTYANKKNCLIFLDPPYLISCNAYYDNVETKQNIYEHLFKNDICEKEAYILLCLEKIWIVELLFKNKNSSTYEKKYEQTKRKTEHVIYDNQKIK